MALPPKHRVKRVPKEVRRADIPHVRIGKKAPIDLYARLTVTRGRTTLLGPGKVRLLELIDDTKSISEAARHLGMSYRRAWMLIQSMAEGWKDPPVETAVGGQGGGGAALTPLGKALVRLYREMEMELTPALNRALKRFTPLARRKGVL